MAAGFRAALPFLGLSSTGSAPAAGAGFRSPLPILGIGAVGQTEPAGAGFRSPLFLFGFVGQQGATPEPDGPIWTLQGQGGGGGGTRRKKRVIWTLQPPPGSGPAPSPPVVWDEEPEPAAIEPAKERLKARLSQAKRPDIIEPDNILLLWLEIDAIASWMEVTRANTLMDELETLARKRRQEDEWLLMVAAAL